MEHEIRKTNIWVSAQELVFGQNLLKHRDIILCFFKMYNGVMI